MTKKEKELIKRAIYLIHNENEYYEGMDILAKLVGYKPILPDLPTETISIGELIEYYRAQKKEK